MNQSQFLEAYAEEIREKYPHLVEKLNYSHSFKTKKSGGVFCHVLQLSWRGLHGTRCTIITLHHRGNRIWYETARSREVTYDDLNDPASLPRLDLIVRRLMIAAESTENEILSMRGKDHGTKVQPNGPERSQGGPTILESECTCTVE